MITNITFKMLNKKDYEYKDMTLALKDRSVYYNEKVMGFIKEIIEKEIEELISDLKIFIPKENYFLFKGRIGKLIDKALQLKEKSKGDVFVEHIQEHLDKGERGLKLYKIPEGVVGCAICGKTVDEIYEEYKNLKENKNG